MVRLFCFVLFFVFFKKTNQELGRRRDERMDRRKKKNGHLLIRQHIILSVIGPKSETWFGFSTARKCTIGTTWQFLIGVKQCGGHSLGPRLSFGIECIQA